MELVLDLSGLDTLKELLNIDAHKEDLLRTVASVAFEQISSRVFNRNGGTNSSGSLIGVYSTAYYRQRVKKENRTNKQINFIYSGQMQADFGIGAVSNDSLIVGFKNQFNANKRTWLEQRFGKVFDLTKQEQELCHQVANDYVSRAVIAGGKAA